MMKIFDRILLRNITTQKFVPIIGQMLDSLLLVRTVNQQDVYELNRKTERHKLTEAEFKQKKYNEKMIINIPPEIMDLFPIV